jgi:hypothetical protein
MVTPMARYEREDFVSALDRIRDLPPERRERIEVGAARILEQMPLFEVGEQGRVEKIRPPTR